MTDVSDSIPAVSISSADELVALMRGYRKMSSRDFRAAFPGFCETVAQRVMDDTYDTLTASAFMLMIDLACSLPEPAKAREQGL